MTAAIPNGVPVRQRETIMPTYKCLCGAKYRFSDAHLGRKSKCKICDAIFTLTADDAPIPVVDESPLEVMIDSETARQAGVAATFIPPPTAPGAQVIIEREDEEPAKGPGGYGQDLFWSFLFATHPNDLAIFVAYCLILGIGDGFFGLTTGGGFGGFMLVGGIMVGGFLLLTWFIFKGWFASVRFAILESAAAGDEHLPNTTFSSDWYEDYLLPAFQWFMSWFLVLAPVGLFMIHYMANHPVGIMAAFGLDLVAPAGTPTIYTEALFWVLGGLGLFLWPMVVLCVALGGLTTVFRVDLLVASIIRTLPAYLVTVVIVYAAEVGGYMLRELIYDAIAPLAAGGARAPFGTRVLAAFAGNAAFLYLSIVMLRAIGLYYHHFKHRFAWSWE